MAKLRPITRRELPSGHIVVMIEIKGRIYAATYAPGFNPTDKEVRESVATHGYGKNAGVRGWRPYDQSRGCYL